MHYDCCTTEHTEHNWTDYTHALHPPPSLPSYEFSKMLVLIHLPVEATAIECIMVCEWSNVGDRDASGINKLIPKAGTIGGCLKA